MAGKSDRVLVSPEGLELLTAAKAQLGLSFAAIAERAGVSVGTVQRLFHPERGQEVRAEQCRRDHSSAETQVLEQISCTPSNADKRSHHLQKHSNGFKKAARELTQAHTGLVRT
jgi:transcriptional regulator with XRE-family HTH domain